MFRKLRDKLCIPTVAIAASIAATLAFSAEPASAQLALNGDTVVKPVTAGLPDHLSGQLGHVPVFSIFSPSRGDVWDPSKGISGPAPIVVDYTIAAGQTGWLVASPYTPLLTTKYSTAYCAVKGYPVGWPGSLPWQYEISTDPSSTGTYYPVSGESTQYSGGADTSSVTNATPLAIPLYGRWFGIYLATGGGTSGNLDIQCEFSNVPIYVNTASIIPQFGYNSTRVTRSGSGTASPIMTKDLEQLVAQAPTQDLTAGLAMQHSGSPENCHINLNASGVSGPQNEYSLQMSNLGSSTAWLFDMDLTAAPTSGQAASNILQATPVAAGQKSPPIAFMPPTIHANGFVACISSTAPPTYTAYTNNGWFEMRGY